MPVFKPPFQNLVILNVFRPGGEVPCELVDRGFMSCMERGEAVKNVSRQYSLAHTLWLHRKGNLIVKPVRPVKLIADNVFCCCDPYRSPANVLEVGQLVVRV